MRKIITVSALGLLFLIASGCSKPAAIDTSATPTPTLSAATAASTASPSASFAPTTAPSASKEPSTAPTAAPVTAATPTPVAATAKPTTAPTAAPTIAPTAAATATPKPTATPVPTVKAPEGNAKAEALFKGNCMTCHGANLEGDYGPNLTKVGARLSKDKIIAQITNGGAEMPPVGKNLAAADIEALASWLAGMK